MATNWIKPDVSKAGAYMSEQVTGPLNKPMAGGKKPLDVLLADAVVAVRAAIRNGNRISVSATADTVPPEAEKHALVLAIAALVSKSPNVEEYAEGESGGDNYFRGMLKEAQQFLKDMRAGSPSCTAASDPDTDATPTGVQWGDSRGNEGDGLDLTTP